MALYVDTDNAMGSYFGDVDDAFAIAALLLSGAPLEGVSACAGNTSAEKAQRNTLQILEKIDAQRLMLPAGTLPPGNSTLEILALGPLTSIANLLETQRSRIQAVWTVGSNFSSRGRWPPYWPHEFNFTWDKPATEKVLSAGLRLKIIPLNQARQLRADRSRLNRLRGPLGEYLRQNSKRWVIRNYFLGRSSFAVWDLVAAMAFLRPALFKFEEKNFSIQPNGFVNYRGGPYRADVLMAYEADSVWSAFERLFPDGGATLG